MKSKDIYKGYTSYIMAAYSKFLEGSGARVVPLIMSDPEDVTLKKMAKLNGVLFAGGGGYYQDFGKRVFDEVKKINDRGQFYPMWGTCKGFENFAIWSSDKGMDVMTMGYGAEGVSLDINFIVPPEQTQVFRHLG